MTLAGLRATLQLYRDPETACQRVPLLTLLNTSIENLRQRAERLAPQLNESVAIKDVTVVEDITYLGGGLGTDPSHRNLLLVTGFASGSIDALAAQLRSGNIAVVGRIHQDPSVARLAQYACLARPVTSGCIYCSLIVLPLVERSFEWLEFPASDPSADPEDS